MTSAYYALLACSAIVPASAQERSALLGTWYCEDLDPEVGLITGDLSFHENGTFSGFVDIDQAREWNFWGIWELDGNEVTYIYKESDLPEVPEGYVEKDIVVSVDSRSLHLRPSKGEDLICTRK